jgi:hypothetical protein
VADLIALFATSLHVGLFPMERAIQLFKWTSEYWLKNTFTKGSPTSCGCQISQHTKSASKTEAHEPNCRVS